jgi:hypothetical protein
MSKLSKTIPAIVLLSLSGCTGMWKNQCAELGLQPGTQEHAQCVLVKEVEFSNAMNQLSANLNALAIANTPQTYNVYVHRGW